MPTAIYALMLCGFAVGTQGFVFGGLLAEMAADLGVSVGAAGLAVAVNAVTFALGAPLAAIVFARRERRALLAAGLAVLALANVAAAFTPDLPTLLLLRVASGAGAAVIGAVNAAVAVALAPPERRGRALAIVIGGVTLAFVLGLPLGSAVGGAFGWRACFLLSAGIALLAMAALLLVLPRLPAGPGARPALGAVAGLAPVRAGLATSFLAFTATFTIVSFTGPLVNQVTGVSGAGVGLYQSFIGFGSFAGLALGGVAADRGRGPLLLPLACASAVGTGLLYGGLLAGWGGAVAGPLLALAIFVSAAALFAMMPVIQARFAAIAGAATPLALALNGSSLSLGQGAGAALGGLVETAFGFAATGPVGAAVAVLAVLAARHVHRPAPPVAAPAML